MGPNIAAVNVLSLKLLPYQVFFIQAHTPLHSSCLLNIQCYYKLDICVISSQGTAVFWYNLFKSGEGDYRTRHAACPVLVGSKWGESEFRFIPVKHRKLWMGLYHVSNEIKVIICFIWVEDKQNK